MFRPSFSAAFEPSTSVPLSLLIIQPSPFCNIDCDYCYLANRAVTTKLPDASLAIIIRKILASGIVGERLSVVWHAGEPLALPISYYEQAFQTIRTAVAEQTIRKVVRVTHAIQTNGMLIDQNWCDFIQKHDIYVGVSIDGPAFLHDLHRKDRRGGGTHSRVMKGVEQLQRNDIDFHVIAVVSSASLEHADEIFAFFLENGIRNVGFNIEELEGTHQNSTLAAPQTDSKVLAFFTRMYELHKAAAGALKIREFDRAYQKIARASDSPIQIASDFNDLVTAFGIVTVDASGNVSTFSPELLGMNDRKYGDFRFGNLATQEFNDIRSNARFLRVLEDIEAGVRLCADSCTHFNYCKGGAPSNKLAENGTFASTETMYCRYTVKIPFDLVLSDLEKSLGLVT
jgi:uncharacterized protein